MTTINLITILDIYLILGFIASMERRLYYYFSLVRFVYDFPNRWPKLLTLVRENKTIFMSWPTVLPVALTFGLMLIHTLAYNLIWPSARVTPEDLIEHWPALICVLVFGVAMLILDFDAIFRVGELNRPAVEKDLDRAEFWLDSWMAPAVNLVTLGRVNPRQQVNDEVRKSLTNASKDVNRMMWRWSLQIGVRLAFGLSLWLTWAFLL